MIPETPLNSPVPVASGAAIIADDLTGANDSALQFAQQGWDTQLVLTGTLNAEVSPDVHRAYAVTTDVRAATDDAAYAATLSAVRQTRATGTGHIFLKIDSTIRGTVAAQVHGGLAAFEEKALAVVCPAYPRMGRTMEQSQLLVNGTPVAETALRDDPVTPVTTSDLREVMPGASALQTRERTVDDYRQALAAAHAQREADGESIAIVDASSDADLEALAEAIAELSSQAGTPLLPVGSAGLAAALSRAWKHGTLRTEPAPTPPASARTGLMIQVSSLNPVALGQVEQAQADLGHEVILLVPTPKALDTPAGARRWAQEQTRNGHPKPDDVTILCAPQARAESHRTVASNLGEAFAVLVREETPSAVGFVGGDGAFAALNALRCTTLRIIDSLTEGVPLAVCTDGDLTGTPVFTKAGGFGSRDTLTTSLTTLRHVLNRSTA